MKALKHLLSLVVILCLFSFTNTNSSLLKNNPTTSENGQFYQLKIYSFSTSAQVQLADTYFKQAFIPAVNGMGISNIGVFKPTTIASDSIKKIYVLIPFSSMEDFMGLEGKLQNSQSHNSNGSAFLNTPHDKPAFSRYESIILKSFEDFPILKTPKLHGDRSNRIYELRSYESSSDKYYRTKVDMFNTGGEVKLFDRLVFNAVFYGEVISGSKMPNLMYMTTFSDMESRDQHWDAFFASPEWTVLKAEKKYKNSVSHADIILMHPTEYSNY